MQVTFNSANKCAKVELRLKEKRKKNNNNNKMFDDGTPINFSEKEA